jgi:hypothetical protein
VNLVIEYRVIEYRATDIGVGGGARSVEVEHTGQSFGVLSTLMKSPFYYQTEIPA